MHKLTTKQALILHIDHANPHECANHKEELSRDCIYKENQIHSSLTLGKGHEEEEKPTSS